MWGPSGRGVGGITPPPIIFASEIYFLLAKPAMLVTFYSRSTTILAATPILSANVHSTSPQALLSRQPIVGPKLLNF